MTKNVRVGIIGTSWWADSMFLPSFTSHPAAQIVAICGRNHDRAEEMARKYDIPRVFIDYRELIAKGNLDAIVVSTPDEHHYQMTMDALDAGLHVLCEKPLALNTQHAREMCVRIWLKMSYLTHTSNNQPAHVCLSTRSWKTGLSHQVFTMDSKFKK